MKKTVSIISLLAALSVIGTMPLSAGAEEYADTSDYIQSIQLERYALTAEEAASGEAAIHASVYLKGTTDERIKAQSAQCQIASEDTRYVYMRNSYNPKYTYDEASYSYLGGEFTTAHRPFCFGKVSDGTYSVSAVTTLIRDYCMEPVAGKDIIYEGDDTISFMLPARYYVDENDNMAPDNVAHEIICPLTINEDGSATYSFRYVDIYTTHSVIATMTGTIPYYQPELLEVGEKIPDTNDLVSWLDNPLYGGCSFLGNSDDFPLFETDIRFKNDSPCGIYNLTFDDSFCRISVFENENTCILPLQYRTAAVAVGVEKAELSAVDGADYACFYAHDNKMITAGAMGQTYTCDVSYTDGTSENTDVTGAVNAGTSPSQLMASEDGTYFASAVPVYCGDTQITDADGDTTAKVLIGVKGDVDLSGKVDLEDASRVLSYYAEKAAGLEASLTDDPDSELETLAFFLADTDTQSQSKEQGGVLDLTDASNILSYYASTAADITVSWDKFIK